MRKENFNDAWAFLQDELTKAASRGGEPDVPGDWTEIWEELIDRAPRLLMQLAMDTFETNYRGDEAMILMDPPDMSRITDPMLRKTSTDIRFGVKEKDSTLRRYHVAAQDELGPNMTTYMMAYNFCDATEFAEEDEGYLIFQWPRSMVVCFSGGESSPFELSMDVGPTEEMFGVRIPDVPVINASAGDIEELIEHNLLVLFPFFIERYTDDMDYLNEDEEWLGEVVNHYKRMGAAIQNSLKQKRISVRDATALAEAIMDGVEMTTRGYDEVEKRIGSVVQEEILDALPEDMD